MNGEQATVTFHVGDMKLGHEDPEEVRKLIRQSEATCAETDSMTVTVGEMHELLGMSIDCRTQGAVKLTMCDHIKKTRKQLPSDMVRRRPTAAAEHQFKTSDQEVAKLDDERKESFHHLVAMTPHSSKRARPDPQAAVSFLCA